MLFTVNFVVENCGHYSELQHNDQNQTTPTIQYYILQSDGEKNIIMSNCPSQKRFVKILIDQDNWSIANEVSKSHFFFQSDYYTYMILQKDLWDTPCSIVTQTLRFLLQNSSSENKSIIVDLRNDTLTIRDYMYVVELVLEPTTNQLFMKIRKIQT